MLTAIVAIIAIRATTRGADELASEVAQYHLGVAAAQARDLASYARHAIVLTSVIAVAMSVGAAVVSIRWLFRRVAPLEDASREAAVSHDVLADVAHDVRNPLHAIVLATSMLRMTRPETDRVSLDSIDSAAERISRLVDDLADGRRTEAGKLALARTSWTSDALLRDAVEMFKEAAAMRAIKLDYEPLFSGTLYADRERVLRVFSNLIGNALKFVDPGGEVIVRTRASCRGVRFEVADTGPGIPRDKLTAVFDRYYQGAGPHEPGSHGLGLFISKQLVEAHRGEIGVDSEPGRGTTFWFTLPTEPSFLT